MTDKLDKIKSLRHKTGISIKDCKNALTEADFDMEKAEIILRKKDASNFEKRREMTTKAGVQVTRVSEDEQTGVLVVASCETDFVALNVDFVASVNEIAEQLLLDTEDNLDLSEIVKPLISLYKENVVLTVNKLFMCEDVEGYKISAFDHVGKISVLLGSNIADSAKVMNVLMHIVAEDPKVINEEELKLQDFYATELSFLSSQVEDTMADKPEELKAKILKGKMDKFVSNNVLLKQKLVTDTSTTVEKYIDGADINSFIRRQIG